MSTPILTTKLYIPPPRPDRVPRPHLLARINEGLGRKLTLISAPAGFGKTTLVSDWLHQQTEKQRSRKARRLTPLRFTWLSLDQGENDPTRFLTYLIAALQQIEPETGQAVLNMCQSPQLPSLETLMTLLINELAAISTRFIFVLDDYHVIKTPAIHDMLTYLLDHLPPQMHLLITSRTDPPLPLSRLRGQDQLTELRAAELRFTAGEAATFLNEVMKLNLSPEAVQALEARTEGWIVGLQLAALSMRGHNDLTGFVKVFTGSHHYIVDYLAEEVLARQPSDIQMFLLQTSILDRLNGPLCDALTGRDKSQATLEQLEDANLFLIPLDNERGWYRYHHLFANFLQHHLSQTQPEQIPELHRRAAAWYTQQGLTSEAITHALAAGDFEGAATLITEVSEALLSQGEVVTLTKWLERLPITLSSKRPHLGVIRSWVLWASGEFVKAERQAQEVEEAISSSRLRSEQPAELDDDNRDLVGQIAGVRATIAASQRQVERTITLSQRALDYLSPNNQFIRAVVTWNLAFAHRLNSNPIAAHQAYTEAIAISQAAKIISIAGLATIGLGNLQVARNQYHQAERTYRQALQLARGDRRSPLPLASEAYLGLAQLAYEWNDLETTQQYIEQGLHLCQLLQNVDLQIPLMIIQSNLKQAKRELNEALIILQQADQSVRQYNIERRVNEVAAAQVRALIRQGDLTRAAHLAQIVPLPLSQARVHLAQHDPTAALALLVSLRQHWTQDGYETNLLHAMVLQAIALQANGQTAQAIQVLAEALTLAEPSQRIRTFVDEGRPMASLLGQALSRGLWPDYISKLLAAFTPEDQPPSPPTCSPSPSYGLIEPLSEREFEVLQLIAAGLTNQEIADQTYVALSTVKWHIRNIYGKLNVSSRTQAIARARELGMV